MAKRRQCTSCGTFNALTAKECKDCGAVFGYNGEARRSQPTTCAWEEFGRPCGNRGVIGTGTGESQSYCRQHWDEMNGIASKVRGNALPVREIKPGEPAWQYSGWDIERKRPVRAMPVRVVRDERETEDA